MQNLLKFHAFILLAGLAFGQGTVISGPTLLAQNTVLFGGAAALGTVAFVQGPSATNQGGGTTAPTVFGSNLGAGHMVAVCGMWGMSAGTGNTISSITDTQGLTYTVDATTLQVADATTDYTEIGIECGYATGTSAAADTVTCHYAMSTNKNVCSIVELSGQNATPKDQTNKGTGTSTTPSSGAVTTLSNNEIAFAAVASDNGGFAFTQGAGWTLVSADGGGASTMGSEWRAVAVAGSVTGTFTTTGHSGTWVAAIITFKP